MPDDLDLIERFEPLASAAFGPMTDIGVLRARVARRRRRRRAIVAGGTVGVVAVVASLGLLAASAAQGGDGGVDDVHAVAPTTPVPATVPASYGSGPRLVLRSVPAEFASHGCHQEDLHGTVTQCSLGIPATAVPDGINLILRPLSEAGRSAWDSGDPVATAAVLQTANDQARFIDIAGRRTLAMGEVDRVDGSALGLDDRVAQSFEVRLGDFTVQLNTEGVTAAQLEAVVGGLGIDPVDLGFSIPDGVLPAGTEAIAEGQQRLWFEPDALAPERSDDNGGAAAGITYQLADQRNPVSVTVVRDVDARSYVETWADQQQRRHEGEPTEVRLGQRSGVRFRTAYGGVDAEGGSTADLLAAAADEHTVVLVDGPTEIAALLEQIAARTAVASAAPPPSVTPTPSTPTTVVALPEGATTTSVPADGPGWYIPAGLPEDWTLDRAVAQATDGSGEAQLWLTSPSGNVVIVTLKVPRDGVAWHSDRAVLHPLPGQAQPVYAEPVTGDGGPYQDLITERPGAVVFVTLLGTPKGDEPSPSGLEETDELAAALVPASTDQWRAYLEGVPATPVLLEAASLVDLPDES